MSKQRYVNCPRCGSPVAWVAENPYRPFCSERCKLIDLGDWAMERYRVPVQEQKDVPDSDKQD
ncbi:MAG TPA: DNA gyrase inhibitor YacG [Burkholderiales bacterium]